MGYVKSTETECHEILRNVNDKLKVQKTIKDIYIKVHPDIFKHMTSVEYNAILALERQYSCKIILVSDKNLTLNQYKIEKK